jgi:KDO2-lipid IV(A) lauroyltransferase
MRAVYYLYLVLTKAFSVVPFRILYILSDGVCFIFLYLIPYRKKVVSSNIANSFPDASHETRKKLVKGFYKNLSDILLEGLKGPTMTRDELTARYRFINPEVMNDYFDMGQEVVSVGAHYANWEWGIIAAPSQLRHRIVAFYTPLANKLIDTEIRKSRRKLGTELVPRADVRRAFASAKDRPATYFFGADQSPSGTGRSHWRKFLNQDTAFTKGPEFFAKHYNLPVVYFDVQRVRRGYYTVELSVLEESSGTTGAGEITDKYIYQLERTILKKPADYLWSHRRWKHRMPASAVTMPAQ